MALTVVTGNHAAGYALSVGRRSQPQRARRVCGVYPITPQTEIIEFASKFKFTKGRIVPVESEHSAMGVCIGASFAGARSFTASASNGLSYMTENIFTAGYYRLPIVLVCVNRTMGPPWNIWADQGDALLMRDAA
jgi:pyruvate/2-oxoacid:ferredoxin oxidoreductase alpha subunit